VHKRELVVDLVVSIGVEHGAHRAMFRRQHPQAVMVGKRHHATEVTLADFCRARRVRLLATMIRMIDSAIIRVAAAVIAGLSCSRSPL
jgi:hypothetical protein